LEDAGTAEDWRRACRKEGAICLEVYRNTDWALMVTKIINRGMKYGIFDRSMIGDAVSSHT